MIVLLLLLPWGPFEPVGVASPVTLGWAPRPCAHGCPARTSQAAPPRGHRNTPLNGRQDLNHYRHQGTEPVHRQAGPAHPAAVVPRTQISTGQHGENLAQSRCEPRSVHMALQRLSTCRGRREGKPLGVTEVALSREACARQDPESAIDRAGNLGELMNSAFTRNRTLRRPFSGAVLLLAGCLGLTACSTSAVQPDVVRTSPPPPRTSKATTTPPTGTESSDGLVRVSGSVSDEAGTPESLVVLDFVPAHGGREVKAVSGSDGAYTMTLNSGAYTVSCTSLDGPCSTADTDAVGSILIDSSSPQDVDFTVYPDLGSNPPPTSSTPEPVASPTDLSDLCRSQGFTVCGVVKQDGQPVPNMTIEAKFGDQNQTVTTNDRGGYGLKLQIPVATLLCEESLEMLDNHLLCRADGSEEQPVSIDSDESGRIVNFTVAPV